MNDYTIIFTGNNKLWNEDDENKPSQLIIEIDKLIEFTNENCEFLINDNPDLICTTIHIKYGKKIGYYLFDKYKDNIFEIKLLILKIGKDLIKLPVNKYKVIFENILLEDPNFIGYYNNYLIMLTDKQLDVEHLKYIYLNKPFSICVLLININIKYLNYFLQIDFIKTFEALENGEFNDIINETNNCGLSDLKDYRKWFINKKYNFNSKYDSIVNLLLQQKIDLDKISKILNMNLKILLEFLEGKKKEDFPLIAWGTIIFDDLIYETYNKNYK